jgi:hypothetical protein
MSVVMSAAAREKFLAEVRVGVLTAAPGAGRTLAVPVWYSYHPADPHGQQPHGQQPHGPHGQQPHGPHGQQPHGPHGQQPHGPDGQQPDGPDGLLTVLTGRRSRKAAAIRAAGRFGLCVQDASPPYRYVSVEGPLVAEEDLDEAERLAMARRYLGPAGGDRYIADNPDPHHKHVAFRMRPETWFTQDQSK